MTLFGGLYTEANPESLPDGASPLCINCDFNLGKVFIRPGKENVFTYSQSVFEKTAAFTQSVGAGAPWMSGSVTLNESEPSNNPHTLINIGFSETKLGSQIIWTALSAGQGIPGPLVIIFPIMTKCSVSGGHLGSDATVISITDSVQGAWTQLVVATPWSNSHGSPDPGTMNNFQLFFQVFPNGTPAAPWTITVNYAVDTSLVIGTSSPATFATVNATGIWLQYCQGIDPFNAATAFAKIAPTTNPLNNGAQVVTTANRVIISISNIIDVFTGGFAPPVGMTQIHNDASTPGVGEATFGAFPPGSIDLQPAGTYNPAWNYGSITTPGPDTLLATIAAVPETGGSTGPTSQTLQSLNFGPAIPVNINPLSTQACGCGCTLPNELPVFGVEVEITGSQTSLSPDATLTVQLQLPDGTLSPETFKIQLPATTGTVTVGSPTDDWGLTLSSDILNNPNFTVNIKAQAPGGELVTFTASVTVLVFTPPNPPPNINYLKTFAQQDGDLFSLVLGSNGVMYQEDVINDPFVLTAVYSAIEPNTFAESCTVDDREFIALSNLQNGTDIPYTYNGMNFDRLSQVGPGAPPTASSTTQSSAIVSITQPTVKSDPGNPGHLSGILWSAGPGTTAPGTVLTVYYSTVANEPVADPDIQVGVGITISGVDVPGPNQDFNGQSVDGNYTVVSIGQGVPPGAEFIRQYFTVTMPSVQSVNQADHIEAHAPFGMYQVTTATLTAAQQVPNLEVGDTLAISGTGGAPPAGYDGSWQVTATPNASQLQITSTVLNGNVATYGYNLVTGTNPVVGQRVTVTGTFNGNGIFNVTQGLISSTAAGVFSIQINSPDIASSAEAGNGIIFGTVFKFEPGQPVGTRLGGSLITVGIIGVGQRKVCYSFLTRNGYITAPSPILTFDVPVGASSITIGNLLPGPANVIARIVHLTAANGDNFYDIPIPVTVTSNGVSVVNSSTYLNDNTSASITLSFSDGVLLAATAVDVQGNNLFATLELGSCLGLIEYASRVFAINEQNKVPNFLNWSFDGGILGGPGGTTYPAGWTVDPTNGAGGSVVNSPIFGFAYQIQNATGSTQATYGMITQPAFQDEFSVPIIQASITYSTRITAAVIAGGASGNLVVDLYSPSFGKSFGTFSLPLASLTAKMQIFTGTMLTTALAPVPADLLLRIYATAIPTGTTIVIDRNEVFPTEQPNLLTQVTGSYVDNFEAFDESGEGGIVDTAGENPQAVRSAFTLYDTLYLVKTGSLVSTQDNASTEPSGWSIRTVSNSVGTPSIYGVTTGIDEPNTGEAWAIIANLAGGFLFNGGEPIKITEEIQSLWDYINPGYAYTMWVKNDIKNRRIYFAVPLITPNPWLPTGIIPDNANPTTPNVILMLSYRQLNTGTQLAEYPGVHVSYSGRLIATERTRKWSIWTIKAPAAAFLERADTSQVLFLGNSDGNGKIFELVDGFLQDDCSAIAQFYDTYGFVTDEQGQGLRLGSARKVYAYMATMVQGSGNLNIRVKPNLLNSQFAHDLLPQIPLPETTDGDIELPLNETANRMFFEYSCNAIGSGFELSRMMVAIGVDPWSPVRGVNY